jgi:hypothetical protein
MYFDDQNALSVSVPNDEKKAFVSTNMPLVGFKPLVKTPAKPFSLRMKLRVAHERSYALGFSWVIGDTEVNRHAQVFGGTGLYGKPGESVTYQAVFVGRFVYYSRLDDGERCTIYVHEKEYPADEIRCCVSYFDLEEIEQQELESEEIAKWSARIRQKLKSANSPSGATELK